MIHLILLTLCVVQMHGLEKNAFFTAYKDFECCEVDIIMTCVTAPVTMTLKFGANKEHHYGRWRQ